MEDETKGKRIIKATLSAVFQAQEQLRKHITGLIQDNRCLKDEKERDLFFREFVYSTLGLGVDEIVTFKDKEGWKPAILGTVEYYGRFLAMKNVNTITIRQVDFPISKLWERLLYSLFNVYPLAIKASVSMSKEQESTSRTKGFKVE